MEFTVYYHDTDAGGVVYYANYLKYMEAARTEYLNTIGCSIQNYHENGTLFAVSQCQITYRSPARYGDRIQCQTECVAVTPIRIRFQQKIIQANDGRLCCEGDIDLVCIDANAFKPQKMETKMFETLRNAISSVKP